MHRWLARHLFHISHMQCNKPTYEMIQQSTSDPAQSLGLDFLLSSTLRLYHIKLQIFLKDSHSDATGAIEQKWDPKGQCLIFAPRYPKALFNQNDRVKSSLVSIFESLGRHDTFLPCLPSTNSTFTVFGHHLYHAHSFLFSFHTSIALAAIALSVEMMVSNSYWRLCYDPA